MPGRKKEPAKVIRMKGKTHFSPTDLDAREELEIKVESKRMVVPNELNDEQKKLFKSLYKQLSEYDMITHFEVGLLVRYVRAKFEYDRLTYMIEEAPDPEGNYTRLMNLRLKISDEMRKCETDLGLNMFARAKMTVAPKEDKPKTETEILFGEL